MIRDPTPFASGSLYRIAHSGCRRANESIRSACSTEANGLPSLRTGARRQDRALSGRELGILLPLHDTALIDMTSGRIIPLLSFSALCCLIL